MNIKEFNEYKASMLSPMMINKDGTMSNDINKRFSLSYIGGNVENEKIIARNIAEAIYRSCINIIISKLPQITEVQADNKMEYNKLLYKLVNLEYINISKEDSKIIITETIDNNKYELSYDENNENPIDNIIQIKCEDNIIETWIKYDSYTTLCIIAGSPYAITQYKVQMDRPSIENFRMLSEYLRLVAASVNLYIGFASFNTEDHGDKFTEPDVDFGNKLSYQRAILDKIYVDKINYNFINKNNKRMVNEINLAIVKNKKTVRTLDKRTKQIKNSIRTSLEGLE